MKKILVTLMAAMMVLATMVPAFAENKYEGDVGDLKEVAGDTFTFEKFLIVPSGVKVPASTFEFEISKGAKISEDTSSNDVMQVLEGILPMTTTATVTFTPGQSTQTSATADDIDVQRSASDRLAGKTAANGVEWESSKNEEFAISKGTFDFSTVKFPEPGIYRYIITEKSSTDNAAKGIVHDDDTTRVLDVYVTDDGSGNLVVSSYVLHKGAGSSGAWIDNPDVKIGSDMGSDDVANDNDKLDDKTDGFTNEYKPIDLDVKKEVTGNQASRDKYFEVTVQVKDAGDATAKYTVSLANDSNPNTNDGDADATSGQNEATISNNEGNSNMTEVTGAQLADGVKFYLQHGQHIVIRGLPANATYIVTENAEDYKSEGAKVANYMDPTTGKLSDIDTDDDKLVKTSYLNTRSGIIPTGLIMSVGGGALIVILAVACIIFLNRRKESEDEI